MPLVVRDAPCAGSTRRATLTTLDAALMTVGLVVGAGIFRAPSVVAANASSLEMMLLAWCLGGLVSLAGALCYAELAVAYPSTGGDYHFLRRAYGALPSFLFAWSRLTVIQTGSIALLAFTFGDYASRLLPLGEFSSALYAAGLVVLLTLLHLAGLHYTAKTQNVLTVIEVSGVATVMLAGLFLGDGVHAAVPASNGEQTRASFGMMMVFVLLTFGGWSEAAYLSAELRAGSRAMTRVLVLSLSLVTTLYIGVNFAYYQALGLAGMAGSDAVAASAMERTVGAAGAAFISVIIAVSVITSVNATLFTGARSVNAAGQHLAPVRWLGDWSARATPHNALVVQALFALVLIGAGAASRKGFETLVEYTAPVFWLFLLLVGIAVMVLRYKDPHTPRPFRVPLYPLLPIIFCLSSAYMLHASLAYTGVGALVGAAMLLAGVVVFGAARFFNPE